MIARRHVWKFGLGAMVVTMIACALILWPMIVLAQAAAASEPAGFWTEFYSAAKTAGWFGTLIMALMWWRAEKRAEIERLDRKELQAIKDRQTEETIKTMTTVASTLDATQKIVDKIVNGFDAMKEMLRDLRRERKEIP